MLFFLRFQAEGYFFFVKSVKFSAMSSSALMAKQLSWAELTELTVACRAFFCWYPENDVILSDIVTVSKLSQRQLIMKNYPRDFSQEQEKIGLKADGGQQRLTDF